MASTAGMGLVRSDVTEVKKVTLPILTAMVVGQLVGAGVFGLPARFGVAAGVLGAITAWVISGVGFLMFAFVFQNLAILKPNLDAGIFAYAKAGFGDYIGFNSAWGFWAGGNVARAFVWVFVLKTIGGSVPAFNGGNTIYAFAIETACIWAVAFLIVRGVRGAAIINQIVTIAKMIPLIVFILVVGVAAFAVHSGQFQLNLWGYAQPSMHSLYSQARNTMLVTTFVFFGVETAVVYSRYAQRREDVGRATVLGFLGVLCVYALITLVSYGVLPRHQLATAAQPSVASVMEYVVGRWGWIFISVGLVVSVSGAYLGGAMVGAEILYMPAINRDLPRFLTRENRARVPIAALIMTTAMIQAFLIVALFSENAFDFLIDLTASVVLFPYLLVGAYGVKTAVTRDGYGQDASVAGHLVIAALASVFALWLLYAAGVQFILFSCIVYAVGTPLYVVARRENRQRLFLPAEAVVCGLVLLAGLAGVVGLAVGRLTI